MSSLHEIPNVHENGDDKNKQQENTSGFASKLMGNMVGSKIKYGMVALVVVVVLGYAVLSYFRSSSASKQKSWGHTFGYYDEGYDYPYDEYYDEEGYYDEEEYPHEEVHQPHEPPQQVEHPAPPRRQRRGGYENQRGSRGRRGNNRRRQQQRGVTWADEEGKALTVEHQIGVEQHQPPQVSDEETAMFERQQRKMKDAQDIEELLGKIKEFQFKIKANAEATKNNGNSLKTLFGDDRQAHDTELNDMEVSQNFSTAFMMKSDLDSKRDNMIKYNQTLAHEKQELVKTIQELGKRYEKMNADYRYKYGAPYISREQMEQARANAQKQAEVQKKREAEAMELQRQQNLLHPKQSQPPPMHGIHPGMGGM
jgi:tetrahydromethanopterin S-methyltransferase subunit G